MISLKIKFEIEFTISDRTFVLVYLYWMVDESTIKDMTEIEHVCDGMMMSYKWHINYA